MGRRGRKVGGREERRVKGGSREGGRIREGVESRRNAEKGSIGR